MIDLELPRQRTVSDSATNEAKKKNCHSGGIRRGCPKNLSRCNSRALAAEQLSSIPHKLFARPSDNPRTSASPAETIVQQRSSIRYKTPPHRAPAHAKCQRSFLSTH